jgi:hypothetical protein
MNDSKIITFLRNFPAWIVLFVLTLIFVSLYKISGDGSYKEWTSLVLASLFTALGIQRQNPTQSANTTSGDVIVSTPENLDLTTPEAIQAVEQIKEEK